MTVPAIVCVTLRRPAWLILLGPLLLSMGCEGMSREDGPTLSPGQDDIVAIRHFYRMPPWLRDADGRISGFTARAYFLSGRSGKGVFVPGPINITMSVLERRPDGAYERRRVHEWVFDQQRAFGFRVRQAAIGGDSYGFVLKWPLEVEVMGRTIEVAFYYRRSDGQIIAGPPRQMKVPLPLGQPAPSQTAPPSPSFGGPPAQTGSQ